MDEERAGREREHEIFAAAIHGGDCLAAYAALELARRGRGDVAGPAHRDGFNRPAHARRAQFADEGFNFGQFGHEGNSMFAPRSAQEGKGVNENEHGL